MSNVDIKAILQEEYISSEENFYFMLGYLAGYICSNMGGYIPGNRPYNGAFKQNIEANLHNAKANKKRIVDYMAININKIMDDKRRYQFAKFCGYEPEEYPRKNFNKTGLGEYYVLGFVNSGRFVDIEETLTISEAAEIWGMDPSTIRKSTKLIEGKDIRKSASTLLVTREAMERVYGEPK